MNLEGRPPVVLHSNRTSDLTVIALIPVLGSDLCLAEVGMWGACGSSLSTLGSLS